MTFRLSRAAKKDLRTIYLYGAKTFGIEQAETYAASLKQCLTFLGENPSAGRLCSEIHAKLHRHPHKNHLVYYHLEANGIFVVRILSHQMDAIGHLPEPH